jgi:hypothetical protein
MKSNNNNNDDDDDNNNNNNNNTAMGSVHARGDTFLTFGLKALTETNTSRLATAMPPAGFEPAIPATKRPTYALDRAATGIGNNL